VHDLESGGEQFLVQNDDARDRGANRRGSYLAKLAVDLCNPGVDALARNALFSGDAFQKGDHAMTIVVGRSRLVIHVDSFYTFASHHMESPSEHLSMASLVKTEIHGGNLRDNRLNREDADVGQLVLNGGYPGFHVMTRDLTVLCDAREKGSHFRGVLRVASLCHVDLGGLVLQRGSHRLVRLEFGHMKEIFGAYGRIVGRCNSIKARILTRGVQFGELSNEEPTLKVKASSLIGVESG
jgi:hypothetical protein